jgi:hypothetical protein
MNVHLFLHGSIVLLLSQLAGYAQYHSIKAVPADAVRVERWRMSHAACGAAAVFLCALASVIPHVDFRPLPAALIVTTLIVSTYLLCLGTLVAGFSGHRGTRRGPPLWNRVAYLCYLAGAISSTLVGLALTYGAVNTVLASDRGP